MIQRKIKTKLVGKEELFNILALGEATKLPVLLLGEPGVGKTQALLDYAAAKYQYNFNEVKDNTFIIELDEGTKTSEIKGRVNMKSLLEDKKYKIDAPIANSNFILINEVDKGTSGVRNTLLSVMRERALFYGDEIKKCNWDIFSGSCNTITEDEIDNPFWDRFVFTSRIERIGTDKMRELIKKGLVSKELTVNLPSLNEINQVKIEEKHLNKFVDVVYSNLSDRTCSYIPLIAKAVKLIFEHTEDVETIMKTCELLCPSKLSEVATKLESKRESIVRTNITSLAGVVRGDNDPYTGTFLETIVKEITIMANMSSYKLKSVVLMNELRTALAEISMSASLKLALSEICYDAFKDTTAIADKKNTSQEVMSAFNDMSQTAKDIIEKEEEERRLEEEEEEENKIESMSPYKDGDSDDPHQDDDEDGVWE